MPKDLSTALRDQITTKIRNSGLLPIPVRDSTDPEDHDGVVFDGSLDEFLQTVLDLKERAVFVATQVFTDEEYQRALNYAEVEMESVPLRKFLKNIEGVRTHVGAECEFLLTVRSQAFELNFHHSENWWDDYMDKVADAMGELEATVSRRREEEVANSVARRARVIKELNALIRDDNFANLPTQRAMVAYALDSVGDISVLNEDELKSEVQKLNDKLIARGLRK